MNMNEPPSLLRNDYERRQQLDSGCARGQSVEPIGDRRHGDRNRRRRTPGARRPEPVQLLLARRPPSALRPRNRGACRRDRDPLAVGSGATSSEDVEAQASDQDRRGMMSLSRSRWIVSIVAREALSPISLLRVRRSACRRIAGLGRPRPTSATPENGPCALTLAALAPAASKGCVHDDICLRRTDAPGLFRTPRIARWGARRAESAAAAFPAARAHRRAQRRAALRTSSASHGSAAAWAAAVRSDHRLMSIHSLEDRYAAPGIDGPDSVRRPPSSTR